jgi:SAM-dependent methyltransferase
MTGEFIPKNKFNLKDIDFKNPRNSIDFQIILTGTKKKVLVLENNDLLSNILKERDCIVTQITTKSQNFIEGEFIDQIPSYDFEFFNKNLPRDEKFDVILTNDLLTYLNNPKDFLNKLHNLLNDGGDIICSLPNIAHVINRAKILDGDFSRQQIGLNENQIQFFTLDSILSLLDNSGFSMTDLYRINKKPDLKNQIDLKSYALPVELFNSILSDPESLPIFYVFKATSNSSINKSARNYLNQFSKNLVTEKLKTILDNYKEDIDKKIYEINYLKQALVEKDDYLKQALVEKDDYLKQALVEKDDYLKQALVEKDIFIENLKSKINTINSFQFESKQDIIDKLAELDHIKQSFIFQKLQKLNNLKKSFIKK